MQTPQTEIVLRKDGVELLRRIVMPGEYVFGQEAGADIQIESALVSPRHARLSVNVDEWLIEDLGSEAGTYVNDQPVAPREAQRIFPTQIVRLGETTIHLRRARREEAPDVSLAPNVATLRTLLPEEIKERRYAIGSVVAKGGMGAILSAEDRAIRRDVAMKVMLFSGVGGDDLTRFVEEAQITGQLEHPNIVPVHELGVDEQDQPFYTMKYVRGVSLRAVVEQLAEGTGGAAKKYGLPMLLTILQKVCDGLAYAHSKGVIHRDLKPENIMLGEYGEVLVMDWGLAKIVGPPVWHQTASQTHAVVGTEVALDGAPGTVSSSRLAISGSVTMTGSIMGTPQFMSPEQAAGEIDRLDARTDIYALGAILYQLLTLEPPVSGRRVDDLLADVRAGRVIPPLQRVGARKLPHLPGGRVPESLAAIAMKAMSLRPEDRYQSVPELQKDIAAFQGGFATAAEHAGPAKQLWLLLKRHKIESIAAMLIVATGLAFGTQAVMEGRRAERTLTELRGTVPAILVQAEDHVQNQDFEGALEKLDYATKLDPRYAAAWKRRGDLLQTLFRFDESTAAYETARRLDSGLPYLAENISWNRAVLAREREGGLSTATRKELAALQLRQGRNAEALLLADENAQRLAAGNQLLRERIKPIQMHSKWSRGPERVSRIIYNRLSGALELDLTGIRLADIEFLRGVPLTRLSLMETGVNDISPLAGMPLRTLHWDRGKSVDLTPLRGMPLQDLQLYLFQQTDFTPLADLPVRVLDIGASQVSSFEFMRKMPLEELHAQYAKVTDLSPLRGKRLTYLSLYRAYQVADLEPLRGMPLRTLILQSKVVTDLSPIRGMSLRKLDIRGCTKLKDARVLLGLAEIETLYIPSDMTHVEELRDLKGLKALGTVSTPVPVEQFFAEYKSQKGKVIADADISPPE